VTLDLRFTDAEGLVFGGIAGFVIKRAPRQAMLRELGSGVARLLHGVRWQDVAAVPPDVAAGRQPDLPVSDAEQAASGGAFGSHLQEQLEKKASARASEIKKASARTLTVKELSETNAEQLLRERFKKRTKT
ncbi:hypothetical protein, partial [Lacisediminimonas sp.]|uniref:hypothetical protein n=1 Tax=Lacisediminimonas sp. TaxID=3060582 RepID=UPI002721AFEA